MVIYSQRLAGYLMLNGFVLQGIQQSTSDSKKNVFLFKDSDELKIKIQQFKR